MSDEDDVPELLELPDTADTAGPSSPLLATEKVDKYDRRKVPLTILTGYLGAGKSTLLDYILKEQHGYKIAVCMNAKSLTLTDPTTGAQSSQFLSLPNGCLCCSFKDMGIAAIEEMAHQEGVEWVMVELTGLADPGESAKNEGSGGRKLMEGPIIRGFWENEEMGDLVLDGVVCVVDCRNVLKQLAEERPPGEVNEAQKQVACADVILLNKTDLVDTAKLAEVEESIRNINPTLRVYKTTHSITPLEGLFDLRAFTSAPLPPPSLSTINPSAPHDHSHSHSDSHPEPNAHFGRITTITIPLPALSPTQFDRLQRFLEDTLWSVAEPPSGELAPVRDVGRPEVLRTKGLVRTSDGREYVLQGVTDVFELKELPRSGSEAGATSGDGGKVVFIGKGVDQRLRDRLLAAIDA